MEGRELELYSIDRNYFGKCKYNLRLTLYDRDWVPGRWIAVHRENKDPMSLICKFGVVVYPTEDYSRPESLFSYPNCEPIRNDAQLQDILKTLKKNANKFERKNLKDPTIPANNFYDTIVENVKEAIREMVKENEEFVVNISSHHLVDNVEHVSASITGKGYSTKLKIKFHLQSIESFKALNANLHFMEYKIIHNGRDRANNDTRGIQPSVAIRGLIEDLRNCIGVSTYNLEHKLIRKIDSVICSDIEDLQHKSFKFMLQSENGYLINIEAGLDLEEMSNNPEYIGCIKNLNIRVTKGELDAMEFSTNSVCNLEILMYVEKALQLEEELYVEFCKAINNFITGLKEMYHPSLPLSTRMVLEELNATPDQIETIEKDFKENECPYKK